MSTETTYTAARGGSVRICGAGWKRIESLRSGAWTSWRRSSKIHSPVSESRSRSSTSLPARALGGSQVSIASFTSCGMIVRDDRIDFLRARYHY